MPTDAAGVPLAVQAGPANERGEGRAVPLLAAAPPLTDAAGRLRERPAALQGDAGYGLPWTTLAVWLLGAAPC